MGDQKQNKTNKQTNCAGLCDVNIVTITSGGKCFQLAHAQYYPTFYEHTEEEVGRQHQGMDRPGVRQVPEGSGEQGKMEKTGCKIICGAPTTLAVKGLMMMLLLLMMMNTNMQLIWNLSDWLTQDGRSCRGTGSANAWDVTRLLFVDLRQLCPAQYLQVHVISLSMDTTPTGVNAVVTVTDFLTIRYIHEVQFSLLTDRVVRGTRGTVQQRSSSSLSCGRPSRAALKTSACRQRASLGQ